MILTVFATRNSLGVVPGHTSNIYLLLIEKSASIMYVAHFKHRDNLKCFAYAPEEQSKTITSEPRESMKLNSSKKVTYSRPEIDHVILYSQVPMQ